MNDKLTTSTKRENRLQFNWEIATHFGNFSCSNWEKKILFGFGNDTGERSWFHREKNHCKGTFSARQQAKRTLSSARHHVKRAL